MEKQIQSIFNKLKRKVLKNRKNFNLKTLVQDFFFVIYKTLSSARLPLIVVGTGVVVFLLLTFVRYISLAPVSLAFDSGVQSDLLETYDSNANVLFLVMDDRDDGYKFINKMDLVLVDNSTRKVFNIGIDPNLIVRLNKETIPIRNLYNFLDGSSVQRLDNLSSVISDYLAIRIDRYFIVDLSDLTTMESLTGFSSSSMLDYINYFKHPFNYIRSILNFDSYRFNFRTSLNRIEYINMVNGFANFDISFTEIGQRHGIKEGDNITPDFEKIDTALYNLLRNINLLKEQVRVEIYNATLSQGAASKLGRMLKVYGVDVIKTGNYPESLEETSIYLSGSKSEMIANYTEIERLFRGDLVELSEYKYNYSGDIILIIGDNFINQ